MSAIIFLSIIFFIVTTLLLFGIKYLRQERWQFAAVIPAQKDSDGRWKGINLTFYGFFNAVAYTFSVAIFIILSSSVNFSIVYSSIFITILLSVCMPASKIVAYIVEGKKNTFTVGGAAFVGVILTPIILYAISLFSSVNIEGVMAAMIISYGYGEGLGRLACLSFGCCYGKKIEDSPAFLKSFFHKFNVSFYGETKKIGYASNMCGHKVIPVQEITALLYVTSSFISTVLYVNGHFTSSIIILSFIIFGYRFFSEFLRADYRGEQKISAYQIMAVVAIFYISAISLTLSNNNIIIPDINNAVYVISNVYFIISMEILWLVSLIYTGLSKVTGAKIEFFIHKDKI